MTYILPGVSDLLQSWEDAEEEVAEAALGSDGLTAQGIMTRPVPRAGRGEANAQPAARVGTVEASAGIVEAGVGTSVGTVGALACVLQGTAAAIAFAAAAVHAGNQRRWPR